MKFVNSLWSWIQKFGHRCYVLWHLSDRSDLIDKNDDFQKLRKENDHLKEKADQLRGQIKLKGETFWDGYILKWNGVDICLRCWDDSDNENRKISRLVTHKSMYGDFYRCNICDKSYRRN